MAISVIAAGLLIGVMVILVGLSRSGQPRARRADGGDGGYAFTGDGGGDGCDAGDGGGGCDGGGSDGGGGGGGD
jgi:hypothetical protein